MYTIKQRNKVMKLTMATIYYLQEEKHITDKQELARSCGFKDYKSLYRFEYYKRHTMPNYDILKQSYLCNYKKRHLEYFINLNNSIGKKKNSVTAEQIVECYADEPETKNTKKKNKKPTKTSKIKQKKTKKPKENITSSVDLDKILWGQQRANLNDIIWGDNGIAEELRAEANLTEVKEAFVTVTIFDSNGQAHERVLCYSL